MAKKHFLAFDLGAESGRTILGTLDRNRLAIRELNRFKTGMSRINGHLYWDFIRFFEEMKNGMRICAAEAKVKPESIAVDTWGVDFTLLARDGSFLGLPYGYRDKRNNGAMEAFFKLVPKKEIYRLTGIQFLPFNTLYQLYAMVRERSPLLNCADSLLFMPDIFNYMFTGIKKTEFSFATTSHLYNPMTKDWEPKLFRALGISQKIMQEIVPSGTIIGDLDTDIIKETGIGKTKVVASTSHDTGGAVAAVPAEGEGWAYISSGTWSCVGAVTKTPIITADSLRYEFTNEGSAEGTFALLKNVMGLWLLQRCRAEWLKKKNYSYDELTKMALKAPAFKSFVNPDSSDFLNPLDMTKAIAGFCKKTRQPVPSSIPEYVRCILESLALKYRYVIDCLSKIQKRKIERIHIIGGGVQNKLLSQYTANATDLPVIAGPIEATAIGNILVQAIGLGYVKSLDEMREIIMKSFKTEKYTPENTAKWDEAYNRFMKIALI